MSHRTPTPILEATADAQPHELAAARPVRIYPDAWYTDPDLRLILRLPGATLRRARRSGALRHARRGPHVWHRGDWVTDWLCGEQGRPAGRDTVGVTRA